MNHENGRAKIFSARAIALVGIMAATMECGKLALSFLPNIEVVTLLCALYGYVFGIYGVVAAAIFVCIEPLIYGFGSWLITYFLYWPAVAFIFALFGKAKIRGRVISCLIAVGLTFSFGIISSVVDAAFLIGLNSSYFKALPIFYLRGVVFYAVHIVSNAAIFLVLYPPLLKRLEKIRHTIQI